MGCWGWGNSPRSLLPPSPHHPPSHGRCLPPSTRPRPWVVGAVARMHGGLRVRRPQQGIARRTLDPRSPLNPSPSREEGGTHACNSLLPLPRCLGPVRCPAVARRLALPALHHQGAMMTHRAYSTIALTPGQKSSSLVLEREAVLALSPFLSCPCRSLILMPSG